MDPVDSIAAHAISPSALSALLGTPHAPWILDVRRPERFSQSPWRLPTARHVNPPDLDAWMLGRSAQAVVVCCVYGHELSQGAAAKLRAAGWPARYLLGGIEGGEPEVDLADNLKSWRELPIVRLRQRPDLGVTGEAPSTWITRSGPKIDRIACPWLVRRFIDRDAAFHYVRPDEVLAQAASLGAVAYDLPRAPISHDGERCSFDALLQAFELKLPALDRLACIIRGADTDRLDLAAPCAGLLAVSLGMSRLHADDDHGMLAAMMPVYDALYAWCQDQVAGLDQCHHWTAA